MKASTITALLQLGMRAEGDWERSLEHLLRIDADTMGVGRVSYWRILPAPPSIVCELGYDGSDGLFERGFTMLERDCPSYFGALRRGLPLVIEDVLHDPRSTGFDAYCSTQHVGAVLDVPVWSRGQQVGVLCHEHVGGSRGWSEREQELALAISHALSAALEARERRRAESEGARATFLAGAAAALAESLDPLELHRIVVERAVPALGDLALLVTLEDGTPQYRGGTFLDGTRQPLTDGLLRAYAAPPRGPLFAMHAIREGQALLLPQLHSNMLREWGLSPADLQGFRNLGLTSAMAAPLRVHGRVTGAIELGRVQSAYSAEDLRVAEAYALEVAATLERARLYQDAQAAVRARNEFMLLASHELRTPLSSLKLSIDTLPKRVREDPEAAAERIETTIARQVHRLQLLIERMLDVSRIDAGVFAVEPETFSLTKLAADVVSEFGEAMSRAGSSLTLHADRQVEGSWDRTRIEQVLRNLLDNALKFGAGRPIDVSVDADGGMARIVVSDCGIGIPPERVQDVFGRFQRAVPVHSFGGLGLGLYVSKAIVEAHGGSLSVESVQGEGTRFTVVLPIAPAVAIAGGQSHAHRVARAD